MAPSAQHHKLEYSPGIPHSCTAHPECCSSSLQAALGLLVWVCDVSHSRVSHLCALPMLPLHVRQACLQTLHHICWMVMHAQSRHVKPFCSVLPSLTPWPSPHATKALLMDAFVNNAGGPVSLKWYHLSWLLCVPDSQDNYPAAMTALLSRHLLPGTSSARRGTSTGCTTSGWLRRRTSSYTTCRF